MSWLRSLAETYDACAGREQFASDPLSPIDHVEQQAHVEIVLDETGTFLRASVVQKSATLIPATEQSAGRTSGLVAHPLCDKIRYIAADYGAEEEHALYLRQLRAWSQHSRNPRLLTVLRYVERGSIVRDLCDAGILDGEPGRLRVSWAADAPELARLLQPDPKTRERDQGNALVRWRVESRSALESALWKDETLQREWSAFNTTLGATLGFCMHSGEVASLAGSHPRRLRHGGDGAKLISSNDSGGFTFRGRFTQASEVYGLASASTQKAHNALRWLIKRQGIRQGEQVIVSWAVAGEPTPALLADSAQLFLEEAEAPQPEGYGGDAGQAFALRLRSKIKGYREQLGEAARIVVMALDSATPGRMAILYYRELKGSELLDRIERWHEQLAWPQNYGKENRFTGAPAPRDIAEAAYGRRVDEKLRKATVERLLPCIVDGLTLPRDLEKAAVARAANRAGMEPWEFERVLGIACSLVRGANPKENYAIMLEEDRASRDYLYGRLLAIADSIEELALKVSGEGRETNAARLMQRFADHPYTTWRTLALQLRPYIARLRGSRYAGALTIRQQLLDRLTSSFPPAESGESSFTDNHRLSGEFLLGYHCQREALRAKKNGSPTHDEDEGEASEPIE